MRKISPLQTAVALACAAVAPYSMADAGSESMFSFSGFGTVGAVRTDTDQAEFTTPGQTHGATKSFDFGVDSKLGVQASAKFNPIFSATAQVVTRDNNKGNWTPEVEWLFAKAQFNPTVAVRLGRMGAPMFAVSDFRDVNYANTWVRPPLDVYGQVAFKNFDGADVLLQHAVGPANVSAQLFAGNSTSYFERTRIDVDQLVGVNVTAEFDAGFTLRAGHAQGKLSVLSTALGQLVGVLGTTPFAAVGEALDPIKKNATFSGVGFTVDRNDFVVAGEYTWRRTDSYVADTTGWYLSVGHRFGNFTPYVLTSELKVDDLVDNTIPVGLDPGVDVLKGTVDAVLAGQNSAQKTVALGVRWDARPNMAVKFQLDHIKPDNGPGLFRNVQPGFGSDAVNVISASVDFVF